MARITALFLTVAAFTAGLAIGLSCGFQQEEADTQSQSDADSFTAGEATPAPAPGGGSIVATNVRRPCELRDEAVIAECSDLVIPDGRLLFPVMSQGLRYCAADAQVRTDPQGKVIKIDVVSPRTVITLGEQAQLPLGLSLPFPSFSIRVYRGGDGLLQTGCTEWIDGNRVLIADPERGIPPS